MTVVFLQGWFSNFPLIFQITLSLLEGLLHTVMYEILDEEVKDSTGNRCPLFKKII